MLATTYDLYIYECNSVLQEQATPAPLTASIHERIGNCQSGINFLFAKQSSVGKVSFRLQDQTKFHACPVLLSGQVNDIVKGEIATEFVEERLFKGKQEPVMMYKVLGIE
ncbi:MAG: hypothetical protein NTW69_14485 [Chloroflexi bacterium]|nr:hypothetical protein [Chloroflexota bacterium]